MIRGVSLAFVFGAVALNPSSGIAGEPSPFPTSKELATAESEVRYGVTHEVDADVGYVGDADVGYAGESGSISEFHSNFDYTAVPQIAENVFLRVGLGHELYAFDLPNGIPLPNSLQGLHLKVGADIAFSERSFLRISLAPGIYSDWDGVSGEDINVPILIGFAHRPNERLELQFGLRVDFWSEYPVLPGGGLKWQFADQWRLDLTFPRPRLRYEIAEGLELYLGGEVKGNSFRVSDQFGEGWDRGELNGAIVSLRELRAGVGLTWDIVDRLALEVETGYLIDREFDYHRASVFVTTDGAPYGRLGLKARF